MAIVFGSLLADIGLAFIFGTIGGLGAELVNNKGNIEFPHSVPDHMFDTGFLSNLVIGGIAAWSLFFLIDTTDPVRFIGYCVIAGVGGSATLIAMKEKVLGVIKQDEAEKQTENAEDMAKKVQEIVNTFRGVRSGAEGVQSMNIEKFLDGAEAEANVALKSASKSRVRLETLSKKT